MSISCTCDNIIVRPNEYIYIFIYIYAAHNEDDLLQVKVETILIESDMEAKALLDLIPILYMKKLVLGAPKSSIRYINIFIMYTGLGHR